MPKEKRNQTGKGALKMHEYKLAHQLPARCESHLCGEERGPAAIEKDLRDIREFMRLLPAAHVPVSLS